MMRVIARHKAAALPSESELRALLDIANSEHPFRKELERLETARTEFNDAAETFNKAATAHNQREAALNEREAQFPRTGRARECIRI